MADLPKNTTIEGYKILTPEDLEPFKSLKLENDEFMLVSQANKRFSIINNTRNNVDPKDGDFAYTNSSMYVFYKGGWFELVLGTDGINPPGTVVPFTSTNIPEGYIECNGNAVSRTTYSNLFNVIGTIYGSGNGSTTFNVPELRAEFIRGWDNNRGVDKNRKIGSRQDSSFKSHTHSGSTYMAGEHTHYVVNDQSNTGSNTNHQTDGRGGVKSNDYFNTGLSGAHTHTLNVNSEGSDDTYPKNIALVFCIKI